MGMDALRVGRISGLQGKLSGAGQEVGDVVYRLSSPGNGWLQCNGQEISSITYPHVRKKTRTWGLNITDVNAHSFVTTGNINPGHGIYNNEFYYTGASGGSQRFLVNMGDKIVWGSAPSRTKLVKSPTEFLCVPNLPNVRNFTPYMKIGGS